MSHLHLVPVALALACASCARLAENVVARGEAARMLPRFATCPDKDPVRLLIERRCPGGVCGYSCLPHRWELAAEEPADDAPVSCTCTTNPPTPREIP